MKINFRIVCFSLILIGFTGIQASKAQDNKENQVPAKIEAPKAVVAEEIEVVRPYKPVLANAAKIRRNPDLNDTPPFKAILSYQILDKKLELNTDIRTLQYQQLNLPKEMLTDHNFARAGAGSMKTSMAELYLNNGMDEALQTGFFAKQFSQEGSLNKQQFAQQRAGAYIKSIGKHSNFTAQVGYRGFGTYFYGADPLALPNIQTDPSKQSLSLIQISGDLSSNFSKDPADWDYQIKLDANLFKNKTAGNENSILLSGMAAKKWRLFEWRITGSADITNLEMSNSSFKNNFLRWNPQLTYQKAGFKLNGGLNLVQEFGTNKRSSLFPNIKVEYNMVPDYAVFFAGLSGEIRKTSLNEFSFENPFLGTSSEIKNGKESNHLFAGVKGNFGTALGYKASVWTKEVQDLPLFVNNPTDFTRFEIIYLPTSSRISGLDLEVDLKAGSALSISNKLQAINYKLDGDTKAWFRPTMRLESTANTKISDKLNLTASMIYQGKTYGRGINGQEVSIRSFLDLSAGANYQINKKWSAFIQANNLLDQEYQQFLYYPQLGLNLFAGIQYSF